MRWWVQLPGKGRGVQSLPVDIRLRTYRAQLRTYRASCALAGPSCARTAPNREMVRRLRGALAQWRTMDDVGLVTAADVQLMQGLAQRVTAVRPDLVNSDASFGELAWIWGKGHASDGESWLRRLWFCGGDLVAWGWAYLPHQ